MASIYITGASGRLGSAVFPKVHAIPLVLYPSGLKNEIVTDFSEGELKKILNDAKIIIHIAGSVDTFDRKKLQNGNVELTRKIVQAAPKNSRIIFASSISVYGKQLNENPANENTVAMPDSDYSKTKLEAEKLVAQHPDHVILRIGTVYGPQFSDYQKILSKIKKGKMKIVGNGENHVPFVHADDVAEVFKKAVEKGSGTYVVTGEALTQNEIYKIAANALQVEPPGKHVSIALTMFMAGLGEFWYKLTGKRPSLSKEHISVLAYDRVFDCSKAKKELGFKPRTLKKGIEEIVSTLGSQL
ncbi:GDP-L-fucose synthase [Candidatus Bilamarchaeum dharawalense]|uniref:GDP-L-fucose synthase n=1 Tax=Candidatus Bilamarchaeum dharawalense TaxID=2885759 RepID=A0A5E4LLI5_9ARCH|nr:GDP-L-fucose synthase [Candidatus Bilamarchaeum dharawalense]